jgi:hypothetical protein
MGPELLQVERTLNGRDRRPRARQQPYGPNTANRAAAAGTVDQAGRAEECRVAHDHAREHHGPSQDVHARTMPPPDGGPVTAA